MNYANSEKLVYRLSRHLCAVTASLNWTGKHTAYITKMN